MSYPVLPSGEVSDEEITAIYDDMLARKEFAMYTDDGTSTRDTMDPERYQHLHIRAYQAFAANLMNPYTPYKRLLLKWKTGTGKTLGAIVIAMEFIKFYEKIYKARLLEVGNSRRNYVMLDKSTPSVFVVGFTRQAIIRELLRYPEFGYITIVERDEMNRLSALANVGAPVDVKSYRDYVSLMRRRITSKIRNGFFRFYGYQELVNRLFVSETLNLTDLESEAFHRGLPLDKLIADYIVSGQIQINIAFMEQFKNSLMFCDELHQTYNSYSKNNYGVAIQYLLDMCPGLRWIAADATPLSNSPTEIVELLSYLCDDKQRPAKADLFESRHRLRDGALEKIGRLSFGKVSFIQDMNPLYYPRVKMAGVDRQLRHVVAGQTSIPYLKFIPCEMSPMHLETYRRFLRGTLYAVKEAAVVPDEEPEDEVGEIEAASIVIPTDSYVLVDMVFPNPKSTEVGLIRANEIRAELLNAPESWMRELDVKLGKTTRTGALALSGSWLRAEKIGIYYTKLAVLASNIDAGFARSRERLKTAGVVAETAGEKAVIYHERVRGAGILLIAAFMRENDIVDEYSEPVDSTRCAVCGLAQLKHTEELTAGGMASHSYRPARFVLAHSDIERGIMLSSIDKYNSKDNAYGLHFRFMLGSKIIRESYDIKDTAEMHVMSRPIHIAALNQLRGRVDRNSSHAGLPMDRRTVTMYYYLTVVPDHVRDIDTVSPEEYRYTEKLLEYQVCQQIERVMHENAIDGAVHRSIIQPEEPDGIPMPTIDSLYFKPKRQAIANHTTTTFNARGYGVKQVEIIVSIIKRLFQRSAVWKYDRLWEAVRDPPFAVEVATSSFVEENFAVALSHLTHRGVSFIDDTISKLNEQPEVTERVMVSLLFNPAERHIWINGAKHKIEHVGEYYVLFQLISEVVVRDIESFMRPVRSVENIHVNLEKWFVTKQAINQDIALVRFKRTYGPMAARKDFDETVFSAILHQPTDFIRALLRAVIVAAVDRGDDTEKPLYKALTHWFDKLQALVYVKDVAKYKGVLEQFSGTTVFKDRATTYPRNTPLGYIDTNGIHLYDSPKWLLVSKVSMNRLLEYVENPTIIGYFDVTTDGATKFKLRRPIAAIKKSSHERGQGAVDIRLIERGIVCSTKNKHELLELARALKIKPLVKDSDVKILGMCDRIRDRLIELEMKARADDTDVKWLYLWYDTMPLLKTIGGDDIDAAANNTDNTNTKDTNNTNDTSILDSITNNNTNDINLSDMIE